MGKDSPGPKYRGGLVKAKLMEATTTHLIGQSFPKEERATPWVPKDVERNNRNQMPLSPRMTHTGQAFFDQIGEAKGVTRYRSNLSLNLQKVNA